MQRSEKAFCGKEGNWIGLTSARRTKSFFFKEYFLLMSQQDAPVSQKDTPPSPQQDATPNSQQGLQSIPSTTPIGFQFFVKVERTVLTQSFDSGKNMGIFSTWTNTCFLLCA